MKIFFNKILNLLNPLDSRAKAFHGIRPAGEFSSALKLERARADRSERVFSLLLFELDRNSDDALKLAKVFRRRLRSIDMPGWFGSGLGVLLPETPPEGAWKLADDLRREVEVQKPIECNVFYYPFDKNRSNMKKPSLIGSKNISVS